MLSSLVSDKPTGQRSGAHCCTSIRSAICIGRMHHQSSRYTVATYMIMNKNTNQVIQRLTTAFEQCGVTWREVEYLHERTVEYIITAPWIMINKVIGVELLHMLVKMYSIQLVDIMEMLLVLRPGVENLDVLW